MLTHPTIDQLHQLGLTGMARAFTELEANPQSAELSHAEWLGLLLDREATDRYERRLRARLRFARLRHQAVVEDVGSDEEHRGARRGEQHAKLRGEAGAPLGVDRMLEDAGEHLRSLWWRCDPLRTTSIHRLADCGEQGALSSNGFLNRNAADCFVGRAHPTRLRWRTRQRFL